MDRIDCINRSWTGCAAEVSASASHGAASPVTACFELSAGDQLEIGLLRGGGKGQRATSNTLHPSIHPSKRHRACIDCTLYPHLQERATTYPTTHPQCWPSSSSARRNPRFLQREGGHSRSFKNYDTHLHAAMEEEDSGSSRSGSGLPQTPQTPAAAGPSRLPMEPDGGGDADTTDSESVTADYLVHSDYSDGEEVEVEQRRERSSSRDAAPAMSVPAGKGPLPSTSSLTTTGRSPRTLRQGQPQDNTTTSERQRQLAVSTSATSDHAGMQIASPSSAPRSPPAGGDGGPMYSLNEKTPTARHLTIPIPPGHDSAVPTAPDLSYSGDYHVATPSDPWSPPRHTSPQIQLSPPPPMRLLDSAARRRSPGGGAGRSSPQSTSYSPGEWK